MSNPESDEMLEDLQNDIARSNYAGMLHDTERHQKYYAALHSTISSMKAVDSNKYIAALDIGSGTGILSMMAAKAGADSVTACEMFTPMAETSQNIISLNNLNKQINVVNKCSNDLIVSEDMKTKADLLVTEIFDTELIGEGVIPILNDAHKRLLKPNCKVIPHNADMKVQLIESSELWYMNKLVPQRCHLDIPQVFSECLGTAAAHEIQVNQLYPDRLKLLTESILIETLDFQKQYQHNFNSKISMSKKTVKITNSGSINAVLFWWDLYLEENKNIRLSMEPLWHRQNEEYVWRDHWMQAVYYLPKPLDVAKNDNVYVTLYFDDYSVWFHVTKTQNGDFVDRPLCTCKLHTHWSRERFAFWNNSTIQDRLKFYLENFDKKILLVGETSLLTSYDWNVPVISYECSESSFDVTKEFSVCKKNENSKHTRVLKDLSSYHHILFDPIFSSCLFPWDNIFKLWDLHNKLNFTSNPSVTVSPRKAQLTACVVNLKHLWKVRSPVCSIEGFDASLFDQLMSDVLSPVIVHEESCETVEPFSMWEYESTLLSQPKVLAEFEITNPLKTFQKYSGRIYLDKPGEVHAVVIWMDFIDDFTEVKPWTTGLDDKNDWVNYSRQGVYFLKESRLMASEEYIDYLVITLPDISEIMYRFS